MKTWVIGDTHFGHKNIIEYESRPFQDTDEMDRIIIKNWNKTVSKGDIVYHMGDVSFKGVTLTRAIMNGLNGRKFLIKGNHDIGSNDKYINIGFEKVYDKPIILHDFIIMSHAPLYLRNLSPFINIHGHIHSKRSPSEDHFNVSVEWINYTPLLLDSILSKYGYKRQLFAITNDEEDTEYVQKNK